MISDRLLIAAAAVVVLLVVTFPLYAAPFLVTAPYAAGAVLPEQCVLKQTGQTDKVTDLHTDAQGGKRCAWDLAGYAAAQHTFAMIARKAGVPDSSATAATCDLRAPTAPPAATLMPTLP